MSEPLVSMTERVLTATEAGAIVSESKLDDVRARRVTSFRAPNDVKLRCATKYRYQIVEYWTEWGIFGARPAASFVNRTNSLRRAYRVRNRDRLAREIFDIALRGYVR